MLGNIKYFNILNEKLFAYIESLFIGEKYNTENELTNNFKYLQAETKKDIPSLISNNLNDYKFRYKIENSLLEAMEFDYSYKKVENDILVQVLLVLCNKDNYPKTKKLLLNTPRSNIFEIKKYTELYTSMLLKNIVLTSK